MAKEASNMKGGGGFPWRLVGWSIPVILLLLPLVAMRFTDEVNWTVSDFIFAALLFGIVGLAFETIVRASPNTAYRLGAAVAVVASFLTIWINGAVGMIGSEDNPYNLLFLGVIVIALAGAVLVQFRPAGMALAMAAAAIAQFAAGAFGLATDVRGGFLSMIFAGLWVLASGLFRAASRTGDSRVGQPG